jgi:hypothetical protein
MDMPIHGKRVVLRKNRLKEKKRMTTSEDAMAMGFATSLPFWSQGIIGNC